MEWRTEKPSFSFLSWQKAVKSPVPNENSISAEWFFNLSQTILESVGIVWGMYWRLFPVFHPFLYENTKKGSHPSYFLNDSDLWWRLCALGLHRAFTRMRFRGVKTSFTLFALMLSFNGLWWRMWWEKGVHLKQGLEIKASREKPAHIRFCLLYTSPSPRDA